MNAKISYVSTVDDDRHATELQVGADGQALLRVGSNRARRLQAVGRFAAMLPAELRHALAAAAGDPALAAAATQASLVPDEAYRRIEVRASDDSATVTKVVGEQLATPAAFARAEQVLLRVIEHVQLAPQQALTLRLSPLPAQLRKGAALSVELQLDNVGLVPLRLAAPLLWGRQATAATLQLLRADVASAELRPEHQRFVALDASRFVDAEPAISGDSFVLLARHRVRLRYMLQVDWAVGRHLVDVDLEVSAGSSDGPLLFEAALLTEPVTVDVLGG